jgi:hypothetical protein
MRIKAHEIGVVNTPLYVSAKGISRLREKRTVNACHKMSLFNHEILVLKLLLR